MDGRRRRSPVFLLVAVSLALAAVAAARHLRLDLGKLKGLSNLAVFFQGAFPPDRPLVEVAIKAVLETLEIAFLGTLVGAVLALPLMLLAANNLFPGYVTAPIRMVLSAIRTLPALLWAFIFVIAVGFGELAGVLAMAMHTVGYLGKLGSEAIEGIDAAPLEAVTALGGSKAQLIRFVALPEGINGLLSQCFFMLEYNVRASTILGFVGAGGIGYYITGYFQWRQYSGVFTLLLVMFATVVLIEWVGSRVRARFLATPTAARGVLA